MDALQALYDSQVSEDDAVAVLQCSQQYDEAFELDESVFNVAASPWSTSKPTKKPRARSRRSCRLKSAKPSGSRLKSAKPAQGRGDSTGRGDRAR